MTHAKELPPFSATPTCPKCSYKDAFTEHKPAGEPRSGSGGWGTNMPERLERRCARCDFVWDEALNPPEAQPDFTSPIAGRIEVRDPCPHCGDHQMIPRHQFAEHIARLHPDADRAQPDSGR